MHSRLGWLVVMSVCLIPPSVQATPANKKALEAYLGPFLKRPIECRVCHLPDAAGDKVSLDEVDKPHNAFGTRLKLIRKQLAKAGKPNDLETRLDALAQEDSDGDGVKNLIELLTGHNPGEGTDQPTDVELKQTERLLAEFARYQQRYRWEPFETVTRPTLPKVSPDELMRQPFDAFIMAERQAQGLAARPEALRETLLRRVYIDLTGLPPTTEERTAFLSDASPNAYEQLVDKLLASPRYGERWGRHWMDVWRYSDWAGYAAEIRESQPHIWHWRDWIIDSLNEDKGYDQMIREMLAGDELAPDDDKTIRATGFLVRNWFKFNRNVWLDNTVEHTAKAFLGLTVNCARCHDHMYDNIKQTDYYSFKAIFEPLQIRTDRVPGQPDVSKDGLPRVYDADLEAKTYLFTRGNEKMPDKEKLCPPGLPTVVRNRAFAVQSVPLPVESYDVAHRLYVLQEAVEQAKKRLQLATVSLPLTSAREMGAMLSLLRPGVLATTAPVVRPYPLDAQAAQAELLAAQLSLSSAELALRIKQQPASADATLLSTLRRQLALTEAKKAVLVLEAEQLRATKKKQADVTKKLKQAEVQLQSAQAQLLKPIEKQVPAATYPSNSSGRRLALARWITETRNPLAARVAVNHIWLRHFGQPLVSSVFDFGNNGQQPTHPALLDWLAAEFMEHGWSLKKLHKMIVTSSTYRLDSTPDIASISKDPDNRYYWRRLPLRMQAEVVRDSLLHLAGKLDFTLGGPELDYEAGLTTFRRSLYYRHANEKQMTFLISFDAPTPTECYRRVNSVAPQQALALANSSLAQEASAAISKRLTEKLGPQMTTSAFIQAGFLEILGRAATVDEQRLCQTFLNEQEKRTATTTTQSARNSLILVLLNHHEFVTVR